MAEALVTIREAEVVVATAPLVTPFRIATGQHDRMENVFLRLKADNGIYGYGEAAVASHITGETVTGTRDTLQAAADRLVGRTVSDLPELVEEFSPCFTGNHAGLAAFEAALLDIYSRTRGIPLHALFSPPPGCSPRYSFQSDITIVIGSLEEAERAAQRYAAQGFTTFKIKIGRDHELDLVRVRAVRRAAPDSSLILDANMGFTADAMLAFLRRLEGMGIRPALVEQPVPKADWEGLAMVTREAARSGILVCADESVGSLAEAERAIASHTVSAINIKFMKSGIAEAARIARFASVHGIRLMLGAMMESSLAITTAAHFAAGMGCFDFIDLDTTFFISGPFAHSPYLDAGGRFNLAAAGPGIGVAPPLG
ncbi:dipeptide epimerase [Trichlorobacter ammonificans]|uniref:Dipeptide epimerase n=1 Tax=Trichlorobacter ammonificans TaxID=2916410 RepID=A0ABM9D907_9BACT|nr:dipeptide epimerase [Trichlorobacter ammonificans]CAH2031693.1 Hydrophobic dipeptide epimerase [Trichlorobacter ammonificans]